MSQDDNIYDLTAKGQQELRGGKTSLAPVEIELLVRMNGQHRLGKIKSDMRSSDAKTLTSAFNHLLNLQLLSVVELDPFASRFLAELDDMAMSLASPEADSGAATLKKSGYYVSIARPRGPVRTLAAGEKLTAIVVEDEPMLAKFIESYLTLEGFKVTRAGNRAEVVTEFRKTPAPDLILLDVVLPDADGFDILLRLRQHKALKDVRVILLTGKATREDVLKGLASGADGYVTKPFEAEVLTRAVKTVMGLSENNSTTNLQLNPWINADAKTRG